MNPIKNKLADFLFEKAKSGMDQINSQSPCAKALENLDRESVLRKDIQRICDEVNMIEAGTILSLSARIKAAKQEDKAKHKKEIKAIAAIVVKRVEEKSGKLNLPEECRDLLMNL
ncbi:MAG: hypothetical protein ABIH08_00170 [Candidatus Omnitrophota bacterium]